MCFTRLMKKRMNPIFDHILAHPFLQDLFAGRLPDDVFIRHIVGDIRYFPRQAAALQRLAARSKSPTEAERLLGVAAYILNVEQKTYQKYLQGRDVHFALSQCQSRANERPSFFADRNKASQMVRAVDTYTTELDTLADRAPIIVATGGFLICFSSFKYVGLYNPGHLIVSPLQKAWLQSCRGGRFVAQEEVLMNLLVQRAEKDESLHESTLATMECVGELELGMLEAAYSELNQPTNAIRFCA